MSSPTPFTDADIQNADHDLLTLDGDSLCLQTNTGSMWQDGAEAKNVCLFGEPTPFPCAEVTVNLTPQAGGEQAGIVFFHDFNNYIKLVREMVEDKHVVVLAKSIDGQAEPVLIEDFVSPDAWLRLSITDDGLTATWRAPDSLNLRSDSHENWLQGKALRVGLFAHGFSEDNQAVFSGLNL